MSAVPRTLVQVFFHPSQRTSPRLNFEIVEVDFPDLEQFLIAASDPDRLISGSSLRTVRGDEPGIWMVLERCPIAFRGRAIERAQLPRGANVEVGQ